MNEDLTGRRVHQKDGAENLGPLIGVVRDVQWSVEPLAHSVNFQVALLVETPNGDLVVVGFDEVRLAK